MESVHRRSDGLDTCGHNLAPHRTGTKCCRSDPILLGTRLMEKDGIRRRLANWKLVCLDNELFKLTK